MKGASTADHERPDRRDFLMVTGSAFAAVGAAMALWPMLDQMNPDASTMAEASLEVDLSSLMPGQALTVLWRRKPVFIRYRTAAELAAARAVAVESLRDIYARNPSLPEQADASDANRVKPGHEQYLVVLGVCTHLGCVPRGQSAVEAKGAFGGWLCSCHWSQYDTSGRIRQGPAPRNLDVPPYRFLGDAKILIG